MTNLTEKTTKEIKQEFMEAVIMGAGTNVDIDEINDFYKRTIKEKKQKNKKSFKNFLGLVGLSSIPILIACNLMSYHNAKSFIKETRGNIAGEYSKSIVKEGLRFPLIFGNYLGAKNYLNSEKFQKDQEEYLEMKKRWREESVEMWGQGRGIEDQYLNSLENKLEEKIE